MTESAEQRRRVAAAELLLDERACRETFDAVEARELEPPLERRRNGAEGHRRLCSHRQRLLDERVALLGAEDLLAFVIDGLRQLGGRLERSEVAWHTHGDAHAGALTPRGMDAVA